MTLEDIGLDAARLIGGFAGSIVHVFTTKKFDPLTSVGAVVVGTLTANFLGPAVQHYTPDFVGKYGGAFVCGYCAIIILQGVEIIVRKRFGNGNNHQQPKEP